MIGILMAILPLVLVGIPVVSFPPEAFTTYIDIFFDVVDGILFFLPAGTIFGIFSIFIAIQSLRITIAFFKTLWDVLPLT